MGQSRHVRNHSRARRQTHRPQERSPDGSSRDARHRRVRNRGLTPAQGQAKARANRKAGRRGEIGEQIMTEPGALAGLRVLDLTGHRAQLCARLLADMGADVIKVEPPVGDDARRIGPFLDDLPHLDRSLFFWFYNLNKRSLTLDLNHSRGADLSLQLARSADVVIESFAPGTLDRLGRRSGTRLSKSPALVLCTIAPFGQAGPYRDFIADDTVLT